MTPNVSCNCVCLYNWFNTIFGLTSRRSSIHTRIPSRLVSSRRSVIPSTFLSLCNSEIFSIKRALLTKYGNSVTTILFLPLSIGSISVTARTRILPRPVRYASSIPRVPRICAPVGKSGPLMICIISSMVVSLSSLISSIICITALITSRKLCGGMLVAIPTAIPEVPFTSRFGYLDGNTVGSFSVSSKFGIKSTVSLPISASISTEILLNLASV
ncbi:unknown [Clostridium sp. CAG:75]|nr:unknown [Clostridium sp. CAG:75]